MEQLNAFFNENGIEDDEKNGWIFFSSVESSTYASLRSLLTPAKQKEKYKELMGTLNSHFSPPPSETAESFRFNKRIQLENKSVMVFVRAPTDESPPSTKTFQQPRPKKREMSRTFPGFVQAMGAQLRQKVRETLAKGIKAPCGNQ